MRHSTTQSACHVQLANIARTHRTAAQTALAENIPGNTAVLANLAMLERMPRKAVSFASNALEDIIPLRKHSSAHSAKLGPCHQTAALPVIHAVRASILTHLGRGVRTVLQARRKIMLTSFVWTATTASIPTQEHITVSSAWLGSSRWQTTQLANLALMEVFPIMALQDARAVRLAKCQAFIRMHVSSASQAPTGQEPEM